MQESNIDQFLLYTPQLGTEPTTQVCALTKNCTCNLSIYRKTPIQLSHTGQGCPGHSYVTVDELDQLRVKSSLALR